MLAHAKTVESMIASEHRFQDGKKTDEQESKYTQEGTQ